MSKEAYFSIGSFAETQRVSVVSRLSNYAYVVPIEQGQLSRDVQLGLVMHEEDEHSKNALALAQASDVPTLVIHRRLDGRRPTHGQYHATRVDSYGLNPFLCFAIAHSIVDDKRLAHSISRLAMVWRCSVKGAEILALLCHTSTHAVIAEMTGHSGDTIKSHIRRLIKNAVSQGATLSHGAAPESGQDLMRLVLWDAYGKPSARILPRDRKAGPDAIAEDDDEA